VKQCDACGLRGYSRELCTVHIRHCRKHPQQRELSAALKFGLKVMGGLALGASAGVLVATAASFVVGSAATAPAFLLKLVSAKALFGGLWGASRALTHVRLTSKAAGGASARRLNSRQA